MCSKNQKGVSTGEMMKKTVFRRLLLFIAVMLAMLACSVVVYAATEGNFEYSVINGNEAKITGYSGGGQLVIPATLGGYPVTTIGSCAFCDNRSITGELTIPSNIKTIERRAFEDCHGLTGLTIENGVKTIGDSAFYCCRNLTGGLTIPASVTSIGEQAFQECAKLDGNLVLNEGLISIGKHAFVECTGLTGNLTIPDSVTSIGNNAFVNCSGLNGTLSLGSDLVTIGDCAFSDCTGLTGNLAIPDNVTSIGEMAFSYCNLNGTLTIGNSVTSIGRNAFYECNNLTGDLTIPDSVTEIGFQAFTGCTGLNGDLSLGNGLVTIGKSAFFRCTELKGDIDIPATVTTIGDQAFASCGSLTGLTIENGVTSIGKRAFSGCEGLTGNVVIPNSVVTIGESAFRGCKNLTGDLIIPDSVQMIGEGAFNGAFSGVLKIPAGLTDIGGGSFGGTDVICEAGNTAFTDSVDGKHAYGLLSADGKKLVIGCKNTELLSGLEEIDNYAFSRTRLSQIIIPDSVTSIGLDAFYNTDLKSLEIPSGVTYIGGGATEDCALLTKVVNHSDVSIYLYGQGWKDRSGATVTEIANGTAVRGNATFDPDPVNPDPSDPSQKDPNASDATDSKDDITNPYSEVHKTDGTNVAVGSVSCGNAKWIFDAEKSDTVMAVKKIDISKKFASYTKEQGYDSAANHRYMTDNKKIAKITKKGVLKLKKSGVITVTYEQKKKGESWTKIGEPVKIYIQKPEMIKKQQESFTSGGKLDAFKLLSKTTYRPTKWMSSKPSVASVDPETGEINMHKKGTVKILAIYGEGSQSTDKKIYTKLQLK